MVFRKEAFLFGRLRLSGGRSIRACAPQRLNERVINFDESLKQRQVDVLKREFETGDTSMPQEADDSSGPPCFGHHVFLQLGEVVFKALA